MSSAERPSKRVVEQRLRNRAIEALESLADGDEGVRAVGLSEYVEQFFDTIDDRSPWSWKTWGVFTEAEVAALSEVHDLLVAACEATDRTPGVGKGAVGGWETAFLASGWPSRIQLPARRALDLMVTRGRFSEDVEEAEPTPRSG